MINEDKLNEIIYYNTISMEDIINATYISDEHKGLIAALYNEDKERESLRLHDECGNSYDSDQDYYYYSQVELKLLEVVSIENKILIKGGADKLLSTYKDQVVQLTNTVRSLVEFIKENEGGK